MCDVGEVYIYIYTYKDIWICFVLFLPGLGGIQGVGRREYRVWGLTLMVSGSRFGSKIHLVVSPKRGHQ